MAGNKFPMSPVGGSSMVEECGYDMESRTLRVKFKGGKTYEHSDVPPEKYAALTGAESFGKFYSKKIRDAYSSQQIKKRT